MAGKVLIWILVIAVSFSAAAPNLRKRASFQIACVVRLSNSSNEADFDTFRAASRTWGAHCRWFLGLAPSLASAEIARRLTNGTRARVLPAPGGSSPAEALRLSWTLQGAFPGGPPDFACALQSSSLFLLPENLLAALQDVGLNPLGGEQVFTAVCGSRLMCQTSAAGYAMLALSPQEAAATIHARAFRLSSTCGQRIQEGCSYAANSGTEFRPEALHASSWEDVHSLYATMYLGWPLSQKLGCDKASFSVLGSPKPGAGRPPRVAVLIGSLLRSPASSLVLLGRLFTDPNVEYKIFVYTGPLANVESCLQATAFLTGDWVRAELRVAGEADVMSEDRFQAIVGSRHMRQWFKLKVAYSMMEDYEKQVGRKFDVVFKTRTDIEYFPLDLGEFPLLMTSRVVYSAGDMMFISNREVSQTLLGNLLQAMAGRAGDETRLFPLDYGRLLRADPGNGLTLQVYPDVGDSEVRKVITNAGPHVKTALRRKRKELEAAHEKANNGESVPTFSGHWRFRNDTKQYQHWLSTGRLPKRNEMCSMKHWFYHVHVAEPEVLMQGWPSSLPLKLSSTRHYHQCNCEPPECIPEGWTHPWPEIGNVHPA